MSDLIVVMGTDCLDYIDKPIGFGSHARILDSDNFYEQVDKSYFRTIGNSSSHQFIDRGDNFTTTLYKWKHNINLRKIGLVTGESDDGGLQISILSNDGEEIGNHKNYVEFASVILNYSAYVQTYTQELQPPAWFVQDDVNRLLSYDGERPYCVGEYRDTTATSRKITFDDIIDYTMQFFGYDDVASFPDTIFEINNRPAQGIMRLTNNKDTTLEVGHIYYFDGEQPYPDIYTENPLNLCGGNLYNFFEMLNVLYTSTLLYRLPFSTSFDIIMPVVNFSKYIKSSNFTSLCYNLILTKSEAYAKNYLDNGTLPPDAFLYPLDWNNLPQYDEPVPTGDKPDDYPDDNNPDDDIRDFDPTPNETPTYTVNQLTNYNWYWLTVPEWSAFISWFWNDIGNYSDFDDIIAKVKGLYNDIASAVIMCRYYPVDISWIGGLGEQSNIKLGMIEKAGAVDTISQANALRSVDIGHVHIGQKYKSFMDMSPYSQLSLYLPWHGFIDLDMNLFNGHDVYVKALYDYLSGTIQYYVFYDNEVLVNTILCKMAMDIPITLQTKNDRDSAIFNNVSSTIGGLVGAGAGILSGNPIGMTLGITQGVGAFNSANASAPMRLMGNVGESGAYIGCQNCFVVVRRPTIQPSDGNAQTSTKGLTTWKRNVGMLCGYGYTLSDLSGQGFTTCHSPRIDFTSSAPLQSEVDEIYDYLEKGVIL